MRFVTRYFFTVPWWRFKVKRVLCLQSSGPNTPYLNFVTLWWRKNKQCRDDQELCFKCHSSFLFIIKVNSYYEPSHITYSSRNSCLNPGTHSEYVWNQNTFGEGVRLGPNKRQGRRRETIFHYKKRKYLRHIPYMHSTYVKPFVDFYLLFGTFKNFVKQPTKEGYRTREIII